jgi:hypothetical protein
MAAVVQGVPQLRARFKAIGANEKLMKRLALRVVREQKLMVPRKTGNLGRSIRIGAVSAREAETIASAHYAIFVETGTKAHDIRPKNKKALSWKTGGGKRQTVEVGGRVFFAEGAKRRKKQVHFAKRVRHPGTKAKPFMVPGAQKALRDEGLADIVIAAWNEAA